MLILRSIITQFISFSGGHVGHEESRKKKKRSSGGKGKKKGKGEIASPCSDHLRLIASLPRTISSRSERRLVREKMKKSASGGKEEKKKRREERKSRGRTAFTPHDETNSVVSLCSLLRSVPRRGKRRGKRKGLQEKKKRGEEEEGVLSPE